MHPLSYVLRQTGCNLTSPLRVCVPGSHSSKAYEAERHGCRVELVVRRTDAQSLASATVISLTATLHDDQAFRNTLQWRRTTDASHYTSATASDAVALV